MEGPTGKFDLSSEQTFYQANKMGKPKNGFENIIREVLKNGAAKTAQEWVEAIRKDYGRAPLIFERMAEKPEILISHLLYKNSVLKTGTLEPKIVELISLAVSAALRCNHCTDYHVQAALRKGASPDQILEAIMVAGLTSQSTVLADAYRTYSDTMEECISCGMKIPETPDSTTDSGSSSVSP